MTLFASIVHHPVSYGIGPLQFTGFGLAVLLSFVVSQIIAQSELERRGFDPAPVSDLIFAAAIAGLLGAKLYYAVLTGDFSSILSRGGFVFWGGLIGGIAGVSLMIVLRKLPLMRIADVAGLALPAAYAVGRTGCWAVGDDYGKPWDGALATAFPEGAPPSTAENLSRLFNVPVPPGVAPGQVLAVHPTQLYEVAMGLVMFAIVWRLRDHKRKEGWLFGVYCVLAGIERFIVEFFRAKDDRFLVADLTVAQLIALAFALLGVVWMWWRRGPASVPARAAARRS